MGYRIIYGPDMPPRKTECSSNRIRIMVAICFAAFACTVRLIWPEGREILAAHLLPGDPTLTQAAFSELLDNLHHGAGMVESLTVFCRDVLHEIA